MDPPTGRAVKEPLIAFLFHSCIVIFTLSFVLAFASAFWLSQEVEQGSLSKHKLLVLRAFPVSRANCHNRLTSLLSIGAFSILMKLQL